MARRKREEILKALKDAEKRLNLKMNTIDYVKISDKVICICNRCDREWNTNYHSVLDGYGCFDCNNKDSIEKQRLKNKEKFFNKVNELDLGYSIDGEYINRNSVFKCKCYTCGHVFNRTAELIAHGCGCNNCRHIKNGLKLRKSHEQFLADCKKINPSIEIIGEYTKNECNILCRCSNCGFTWEQRSSTLLIGIVSCKSCGDKNSIPNKFMINCLKHSGVEFIQEKIFPWSENRRYDFYVPSENMIIEMHGLQHYVESGFKSVGGRTLAEEELNDKYKYDIAIQNGISKYIVIDSRKSTMQWLSSNILSSNMSYLLSGNIDFHNIFLLCSVSDVVEFSKLYNDGITSPTQLSKILKKSLSTIHRLKHKAIESNMVTVA